jgi:ketosteroid isomerase-like protein
MKLIHLTLLAAFAFISSRVPAQVKREMPFSSTSKEAVKLLRQAWQAYGDAKYDEASRYTQQALERDQEFGMAHAFTQPNKGDEPEKNLRNALGYKLSADEKMLLEGILAALADQPAADYFEPLLKKYPRDSYLNLWIMYNYRDAKRRAEIGKTITKHNPKFAPAYNMLGYAYMDQNDFINAEKNFDKYLSLQPRLANAYDSKGDYMMRVGKFQEAAVLYDKAAELGMISSKGRADLAKTKLKYSAPSEKDKQEIRDLITTLSSAYLKGDVDAILKNYSDHAFELFPNQMINAGMGNIRSRLKDRFSYATFTKFDPSIESIEGHGPIVIARGKTQSAFKSGSDQNVQEDVSNDIFLFRKQMDGHWKILVHHWVPVHDNVSGHSSQDSISIRQLIDRWSFFIKPGEVLTEEHVEKYVAVHSPQAVHIFPNQRSNIGIANIRMGTEGFIGIRWAQFTDYNFPVNSFATIGSSDRAVAWGIGDHSNYWKGSDERSQFLFPWAMILTKEKDGQWRILVYHFFLGD